MNEKVLEAARQMFAGRVKERRLELGLSQEELADATGVARKTINALENGHFWPTLKLVFQLSEPLKMFITMEEWEANTSIAEALRKNWTVRPKAMTIDEAIELKSGKHKRPDQHN